MIKKIIRRNSSEKNSLHSCHDLHPILQQIYANRGVQSIAELELNFERLLPFRSLLEIDKAVACLSQALVNQENILIVGDFDADGATSTALAVRALRSFGAKQVNFLVPNRFAFGYGLTPELVFMAKEFNPHVIITVDNGISNHAGVLAAKELGIKVVITDHHLPGDTLPLADAIINPNQPNDLFPSKNCAGVGVIFYVMLALRRFLSDQKWFESRGLEEPVMARLLDLVALGTVADVVTLDHNNRILVHQGLRRIRAKQCAPGITALLEIAGRTQAQINAADLGFAVAPRLNAAGRLDDMSLGIECLITDDVDAANKMAQRLDQLNDERRVIEHDMQEQAFTLLKKIQPEKKHFPFGICLFEEEWHQGVIGILAGRIKDKLHRPVIAFARTSADELKGSARSIPGVHIRDVLADITVKHPHLVHKFGGHAMAAGLTIPGTEFANFSAAFSEEVGRRVNDDLLNQVLLSDGMLSKNELTLEIAEVIRNAGPWGQAFPEPIFDGIFNVVQQRLVGGKHLKLLLTTEDETYDAIAFNVDLNLWPNYRCSRVNIAYRLDVNEFRGRRSVQLIIEQMEIG